MVPYTLKSSDSPLIKLVPPLSVMCMPETKRVFMIKGNPGKVKPVSRIFDPFQESFPCRYEGDLMLPLTEDWGGGSSSRYIARSVQSA